MALHAATEHGCVEHIEGGEQRGPAPDASHLPVRRMISPVPKPSADKSTTSARQTCFWAALRLRHDRQH